MSTLRRSLSVLGFALVVLPLANAQTPLRFVSVAPCRLLDTRDSSPIQGGAFQTFNLQQLAQQGRYCTAFDLSSAAAYSLNVTVVPNGHHLGFLTIWPTGEAQPVVSLMNSLDGRTKANAAIVPAGTNGAVNIYVSNTTDVIVDIDGFFDPHPSSLAFFPLTPCRIVDTRNADGNLAGPFLNGDHERDFPVLESSCIPHGVTPAAYSFNVTAVPHPDGQRLGFLSVWPQGQSRPTVSTLNNATGTIVANAAVVPAGANGEVAVYPNNDTDLLIDIDGYFAPADTGSNPLSLYPLTPCRVLDTRNTTGLFNGTLPVAVIGSSCGIPFSASAFVLNATVVPPTRLGFLTLWPEGEDRPTASTLNAIDGAITSNMAIVPTLNGSVNTFANNNTQLIVDISSYFAPISPVSILSSSLPSGTLNDGYSVPLVAFGGVAPYIWLKTAGSLPNGLSLSTDGLISGTTHAQGHFSFTVQAADSNTPANIATANLNISVSATPQPLAITPIPLSNGSVNTPYNALLSASGGVTPYAWSIPAGSLPAGLTLNSSTGQISGLPAAGGLSEFTVKVADVHNNTSTQNFSLAVNTGSGNGVLNGSYAFSFNGYADGFAFAWAGSFVADGNGHITSGIYDSNCSCGLSSGAQITGTYSIAPNGLGSISLNDGTYTLLVSVGNAENMRIISMNTHGSTGLWGSGVIRQQNPADFDPAPLAGKWVFAFQGFDPTHPVAAVGSYVQDSEGNASDGAMDVNDFGTDSQFTFTSSPEGGIDSNGRAIIDVHRSDHVTSKVAAYVISANELLFVGIDDPGYIYTGSYLRQSGTMNNGILNGRSVGRGSRQAHSTGDPVSQALDLLIVTDGHGGATLTQDTNTGGGVSHQVSGSANYAVASNGRTTLIAGSTTVVCYVRAQNEGFCINTGSSAAGAGFVYFEPQSGGPFSAASLFGEFLGGTLPAYVPGVFGQIDSSLSDGAGNWNATYTQSGPGGTNQNQTFIGAYTIDATGAITILEGSTPIYYGYVISPTKIDLISLDDNPRTSIETISSAP